jgi:hypothetical protein
LYELAVDLVSIEVCDEIFPKDVIVFILKSECYYFFLSEVPMDPETRSIIQCTATTTVIKLILLAHYLSFNTPNTWSSIDDSTIASRTVVIIDLLMHSSSG